MVNDFDSLNCPLDHFNLVEAAAGTGKTYNIQNLFARLVAECGIPVDRILVVTYTNAAAAELGERIRTVLRQLREPAAHSREEALLETIYARGVAPETAAERIRAALLQFDDAVISTIHGFCHKVLTENAFESGCLFDCELEKECRPRILALARDFYRRKFYGAGRDGALRNLFASEARLSPESLARIAGRKIAEPELVLRTGWPDSLDSEAILSELSVMLERFRSVPWPEGLGVLDEIMNKNSRLEALRPHLETLRRFHTGRGGELPPGFRAALQAVAPEKLRGDLNRRGKAAAAEREMRLEQLLQEPFFTALADLTRHFSAFIPVVCREAAVEIAAAFEEEKERSHFQTFDDLPRRVAAALKRPGSSLLAALQRRYDAGIIDEFQDTDALQYEIFASIFRRCDAAAPLFLVGDPRQAIYAFRGGDIAAYRRAKTELIASGGRQYTLRQNFRSSAGMIEAVNTLFAGHRQPFADPAIPFPPVIAPVKADGRPEPGLLYKGAEAPVPLSIVQLPEANAELLRRSAAGQILAMLNDPEWRIPGDPPRRLRPGDFAVLVFNGFEAEAMKTELNQYGIPAVFSRTGNVFASGDAAELQLVLEAIVDPGSNSRIVRALETPLCGVTLPELIAFHTEEGMAEFAVYQERFFKLHRIWEEESFLAMFGTLQKMFRIRSRYPKLLGGERKLTNLLQLGDLLEQEARQAPAPRSVLEALMRRIAESSGPTSHEEFEQLLETDRNAVTLMTIHGSKGLEFPVVMLPNLAARDAEDNAPPDRRNAYHRDDGKWEFDLGDDPESCRRSSSETFQELLRLAYVAITRAKYRCVLLIGKRHGAGTAPTWLLGARGSEMIPEADGVVGFSDMTSKAASTPLPIPPELSGTLLPEPEGFYTPELPPVLLEELPPLQLKVDREWRIASYSRLIPEVDGSHGEHVFDYDECDGESENAAETFIADNAILALPGGTATGNAWHGILEKIDFAATDEEILARTKFQLQNCGLLKDPERADEILHLTAELIRRTLNVTLTDADGCVFSLNSLEAGDRLSELEFYYRFRQSFHAGMLRQRLDSYMRERFGALAAGWEDWFFRISGGYLNGFIDLVFRHHGKYFIIDWKSNRLGGKLRNFEPDRLRGAMCDSFYFLQYLIYIVALVKYLRLKLGRFGRTEYETLFGGVYYLFLRGLSEEHPGRGIFYEKPEYSLIEALEEVIG